jgi:subtilisin family serine protease
LSVPDTLDERSALDEARQLVPAADFDFNHLFRQGGLPGCADATCWPIDLAAVSPLAANACDRGAPIVIIDTTVDIDHPTLDGARIERRTFLPDDLRAAAADHGTAVAALLVGASEKGVTPLAPGATLLVAEAFALWGDEVRADTTAVVAALDWAMTRRARVIGMSFAGAENRLVARMVQAAARRANIVAAAGNFGPAAPPAFPAAHPDVVAVAAVDSRKRNWRGGNRGDYLEIVAPGVDVTSAGPNGGYAEWTGTSFAVPFAVAAMLRARAETGGDPGLARALIASRAEDLGAPGRDPMFGHGLVQAAGDRCW